jgi:DNA-binding CsgD family transcriptional regulator
MATTPKPIAELLRHNPHPLLVTDLETLTILGANEAAYQLVGRVPPSLEGASAAEVVRTADWPAVEASMELLASGALEGYQAVRLLRKGDGQEFTAHISVRRSDLGGHTLGLVSIGAGGAKVPWPPTEDHITIAGVVTDHDWIIEMVSSDIGTILGLSPERYKGAALLGLLQPRDVQKLMSAVERVTSDGGGATLRVHLRNDEGRWQDVLVLVVAMCEHSPPRLGLAITGPEAGAGIFPDLHQEFAARGLDAVSGADQFRSCPLPEGFSTRQSEILTRLLRGERVQDIAHALYLSPSTVRNHLTAIYRKFGVHSQAELLAKLLRAPPRP